MAADLWRVPASVVKLGGMSSVIQDRGMLRQAMPTSDGSYLFSERGAGVQPLALIGLWHEVLNFIARKPNSKIVSRINDLPDIYMGLSYYRPGKRFVGLFPVHQALTDLGSQIVGIAGAGVGNLLPEASSKAAAIVSHATEVIGGTKDLKEALAVRALPGEKTSAQKKAKLASNEVYIKFSYLQEDGMSRIGKGKVPFKELHQIVVKALSAEA